MSALALLLCTAPRPLAAQLHGQHWTVTPETERATVGDTVTLAFRVRLDERDLLFDTVPKPARTLPDWIRVFGVEKLQRQPDRIYVGKARVAFYRPGRQAVPLFELPFMRSVKGLSRGTLMSDSASVEVVPVLSGSSATLRDIKEPASAGGPDPLALVLGLLALAVAGWLTWRARWRGPAAVPEPVLVAADSPTARDPYDIALDRLVAIERERWSARDVARHYAEVTDALRDYLEAAADIPARERTTIELRWSLPPALLEGPRGRRFDPLFDEADLVKFARLRPTAGDGAAFLRDARALLTEWRDALEHRELASATPAAAEKPHAVR